ncbi:MAG: hypothetical protein ABIH00_11665 [Armatimonadota bacterium]
MRKKALLAGLLIILVAASCVFAAGTSVWKIDTSEDLPQGMQARTNFCWTIDGHLVLFSKDSSLKIQFYLPPGDYKNYKLIVTDRASSQSLIDPMTIESRLYPDGPDTDGARTIINIDVNGKEAVFDKGVWWVFDTAHNYNIGRFLKEGINTVTFTLDPKSIIRYEIEEIELTKG